MNVTQGGQVRWVGPVECDSMREGRRGEQRAEARKAERPSLVEAAV